MKFNFAPNTLRAYSNSWRMFTTWCEQEGHASLPAKSETVRAYLLWCSTMRTPRYSLESVKLVLSAIRHHHKAATLSFETTLAIYDLLKSISRKAARNGERKELAGKKNLTLDQLRKMCRTFDDNEAIDLRDHALLLLGFASGLRRSDLSRMRTDHLHFDEDPDRMRIWIPVSKTDQRGKSRDVWIDKGDVEYTCPVRMLQRWLKVRGGWKGPVFVRFTHARVMLQDRLKEQGICGALKRALERIGEDSRPYGAHSLRSGMITTAYSTCKNLRDIMDRTGHTSTETLMRYVKGSPRATANPLAGVL